MKSQGSAAVRAIAVLIVITIAGAAYWFWSQNANQPTTAAAIAIPTQQTPVQAQNSNTGTQARPTQASSAQPALSADPVSAIRGEPVTFSTSYGGQTDTAYYVDFGDNSIGWYACGQHIPNGPVNEACLPTTFQHTYAGSGTHTYMVTLNTYDSNSFTNKQARPVGTVHVTVSGTDMLPPPTCALTASPDPVTVGQKVTVSWTTQNAYNEGPAGYGAWEGGTGNGDLFESGDVLTQMKSPTALNGSQTINADKTGTETLILGINGPGGSGEGQCSVAITVTPSSGLFATIDQRSLSSSSENPTLTGTASGVSQVYISINPGTGSSQGASAYVSSLASVVTGNWSISVSTALQPGTYTVHVYDTDGAPDLASGVLTIQ